MANELSKTNLFDNMKVSKSKRGYKNVIWVCACEYKRSKPTYAVYCVKKNMEWTKKNIYSEKVTGTKKDRPAFNEMLKYLHEGDTVVVYKLDRIGRSTKHLVDLINDFQEKGINFVSINENIDTTTAMGKLVFTIFSGLAQFERDIISERTKSGLDAARARGRKEEDQKRPIQVGVGL